MARSLLLFLLAAFMLLMPLACVQNYNLSPLSAPTATPTPAGPTPTPTWNGYTVYTYAGVTGLTGSANGPRLSSTFDNPYGLALDSSGSLFVADLDNNMIRMVSSLGVITVAGTGVAGANNGLGVSATFIAPVGLAFNSTGILYVGDSLNFLIRAISVGPTVTTLAGTTRVSGFADGVPGVFDAPFGIAVDSAGNIYVADNANSAIRKVSPGGVVSTLAGSGSAGNVNGLGSAASFFFPQGLAVDTAGNVYVADSLNHLIRKITPAGLVTTFAGSGIYGISDGLGTAASFSNPMGICIDGSGNLFVADTVTNLIREISPAGLVTTIAGTTISGANNGPSNTATFNKPQGIVVDSSGDIFVSEQGNSLIRELIP